MPFVEALDLGDPLELVEQSRELPFVSKVERNRKLTGRPCGLPKTGGRKKGTPNKASAANRELAMEKSGVLPLEVLLEGMDLHRTIALTELEKGDAADVEKVVRFHNLAKEYAQAAAPYCHPRLASITHAGEADGPPIKIESLNDTQLDILIVRLTGQTRSSRTIEG
jgi:hypothetical protein